MGSSYFGYASDITCSYPVNGKFTEKQANIYNAVLEANRAVMKAALPGKIFDTNNSRFSLEGIINLLRVVKKLIILIILLILLFIIFNIIKKNIP